MLQFSEKHFKRPLPYIIIMLIGLSMRLLNINDGLWLDEIWSMNISGVENSALDIIEACKTDTHPPLYDLLLHYFLLLVGDSDISGRILSLIIGFLGIISTFYYTLRITKKYKTSFLAFTLITFSFFHIYYSGEGRFYTFLYFLSLGAISELYLFLTTKRYNRLFLFVFYSLILVYTHYYGAILLFVLSILVFLLWIMKEINTKTFLYFALSGFVILAIFSPWLPYMLVRKSNSSWMSEPKIWDFFEYLYLYTGKNPVEFIFILLALSMSIKNMKSNVILNTIFIGAIILGFIVPFVVSYLSTPMLHNRYTFIYYPCIIILTSIFWGQTDILKGKKIMIYVVVFGSIFFNFFFINKFIDGAHLEPWRDASLEIRKDREGEKINIYCEQDFHLNYYLKKSNVKLSSYVLKEEGSFLWHFKTPYDKVAFSLNQQYQIEEQIEYEGGFVLTLYKKE